MQVLKAARGWVVTGERRDCARAERVCALALGKEHDDRQPEASGEKDRRNLRPTAVRLLS